ncbi:MAG TPA: hypothetical protein VK253_06400 [Candidatus Binatia bacterium]|nr:hypothetical protein [Candidatus Binatia bacterium]
MFEHHHEKLLPRRLFLKRLAKYASISLSLVFASLVIGMAGYRVFGGFSRVDSFLNAAMLMGGMGPVGVLQTEAGKIFAGIYALYCGLIELVAIAIFAAPILHRFLHHFHLEGELKQEQP